MLGQVRFQGHVPSLGPGRGGGLSDSPFLAAIPGIIPPCFYHAAPSQPVSLLMLSSQTLPHRAQGKISTQAVRSERSGKVGVGGFKPGSHCQRSSGRAPPPPPLSCQKTQGPVGKHHCSLSSLPSPALPSVLQATPLTIYVPLQPGEATISP